MLYIIAPDTRPVKLPLCAFVTFGGTINILFAARPVVAWPASAKSTAALGSLVPIPIGSSAAIAPFTNRALPFGPSVLIPTFPLSVIKNFL